MGSWTDPSGYHTSAPSRRSFSLSSLSSSLHSAPEEATSTVSVCGSPLASFCSVCAPACSCSATSPTTFTQPRTLAVAISSSHPPHPRRQDLFHPSQTCLWLTQPAPGAFPSLPPS